MFLCVGNVSASLEVGGWLEFRTTNIRFIALTCSNMLARVGFRGRRQLGTTKDTECTKVSGEELVMGDRDQGSARWKSRERVSEMNTRWSMKLFMEF